MSTSARWIAVVLVAALAITATVLVFAAVERVRAPQRTGASAPVPSFSFGATPTPTTPSPTPAPAPGSSYPREEERFLSIGAGAMWRATAGACGGPAPVVERSTDGGQTWNNVTPSYRAIAQIASLNAFAGIEGEMIAAVGNACEVQALRTFTQGEFWEPYPDVLAAARYLNPNNPASIATPIGPVDAPCTEPRSFRAAGDTLALICGGIVQVRRDGEWSSLGPGGAVAVTATPDAVLIAATEAGCPGTSVTRYALADPASQQLGCAEEADPAQPLALAAQAGGAMLWSGSALTAIALGEAAG